MTSIKTVSVNAEELRTTFEFVRRLMHEGPVALLVVAVECRLG